MQRPFPTRADESAERRQRLARNLSRLAQEAREEGDNLTEQHAREMQVLMELAKNN
jgi:hypothetical protein